MGTETKTLFYLTFINMEMCMGGRPELETKARFPEEGSEKHHHRVTRTCGSYFKTPGEWGVSCWNTMSAERG